MYVCIHTIYTINIFKIKALSVLMNITMSSNLKVFLWDGLRSLNLGHFVQRTEHVQMVLPVLPSKLRKLIYLATCSV